MDGRDVMGVRAELIRRWYIPVCVQRSAITSFYGDVSDGDDVGAMGGACLYWLHLQLVRGGVSCKDREGR